MYYIDNLIQPESVQFTNMDNCNNFTLVNERNEALITENNILKSDLSPKEEIWRSHERLILLNHLDTPDGVDHATADDDARVMTIALFFQKSS